MTTENADSNFWRKCSACKKQIGFGARYYACSVSTCNAQRTGYVFCSVPCFEVHLPGARHKDAAAVEEHAPGKGGGAATAPVRRTIVSSPGSSAPSFTPSS